MLNIRKCREQYSVTAMLIATTLGGPVCLELRAQAQAPGVPSIAASTKGPNQINLTWDAISNPGYGYLVEIQSASDRRYSAWQEMRPIPLAGGYQCDNTVQINGAYCNISDPSGIHVYNPPNHGIPYWVTESNYIDPQDGFSNCHNL